MNLHRCVSINGKFVRNFCVNVCQQQKLINHYNCLGITPKASQSDVKTAYYKLSKKFHPDLNKGNPSAADKFRDITTAYEVLGNIKARKLYDRSLSVRGIDNYSSTIDVEEDNYEHAPFYHARNKAEEKKPSKRSKENVHYDIDEWTRAHYSKTFQKSKTIREEAVNYARDIKQARIETVNYQGIGIVVIVVFAAIYFSYFSYNEFDVPTKKADKQD